MRTDRYKMGVWQTWSVLVGVSGVAMLSLDAPAAFAFSPELSKQLSNSFPTHPFADRFTQDFSRRSLQSTSLSFSSPTILNRTLVAQLDPDPGVTDPRPGSDIDSLPAAGGAADLQGELLSPQPFFGVLDADDIVEPFKLDSLVPFPGFPFLVEEEPNFSFAPFRTDFSPLERPQYRLFGFETGSSLRQNELVLRTGTTIRPSKSCSDREISCNIRLGLDYGILDELQLSFDISTYDTATLRGLLGGNSEVGFSYDSISTQLKWQAFSNDLISFAPTVGLEFGPHRSVSFSPANTSSRVEADDSSVFVSVGLPVSINVGDKNRFHINPQVGFFPDSLSDVDIEGDPGDLVGSNGFDGDSLDYYGTVVGIGLGFDRDLSQFFKFAADYTVIAAGSNSLGNGSDSLFVPRGVWNAGIRWTPNSRASFDIYATNRFGPSAAAPSNLLVQPDGDIGLGIDFSFLPDIGNEFPLEIRNRYPATSHFFASATGFPSTTLPIDSVLYEAVFGSPGRVAGTVRYGLLDDLELVALGSSNGTDQFQSEAGALFRYALLRDLGDREVSSALSLGVQNLFGNPEVALYSDVPTAFPLFNDRLKFTVAPKGALPLQGDSFDALAGVSTGLNLSVAKRTQLWGQWTPIFGENRLEKGSSDEFAEFNGNRQLYSVGVRQLFPSGNSTYALDVFFTNSAGEYGAQGLTGLPEGDTRVGARVSILNGVPKRNLEDAGETTPDSEEAVTQDVTSEGEGSQSDDDLPTADASAASNEVEPIEAPDAEMALEEDETEQAAEVDIVPENDRATSNTLPDVATSDEGLTADETVEIPSAVSTIEGMEEGVVTEDVETEEEVLSDGDEVDLATSPESNSIDVAVASEDIEDISSPLPSEVEAVEEETESQQVLLNRTPVGNDDASTTAEDTALIFNSEDLLGNDSDLDGDLLTIASVQEANKGTVALNEDGTVTFTPPTHFFGDASFTYTLSDSSGNSDIARVNIAVTPVNDNPSGKNDSSTTPEDTSLTFNPEELLGNDSDVDGDPLTIASVQNANNGTVVLNNDSTVTFTPAPSFNGDANFTYTLDDGNGGQNTVAVSIDVTPVNNAPVGNTDFSTTPEDTLLTLKPIELLENDTDLDGDTMSVISVQDANSGTVALNDDGTVAFTPSANFNGIASFSYTLSDSDGSTNVATVEIDVTPVNDGPVGTPDSGTMPANTSLTFESADLLGNDSDLDGDALVVTSVQDAVNGTVVLNTDGTVTFTPTDTFSGDASFTYTLSDSNGGSTIVPVAIAVSPVAAPASQQQERPSESPSPGFVGPSTAAEDLLLQPVPEPDNAGGNSQDPVDGGSN